MNLLWVHVGILCVSVFFIFSIFRKKLSSPKNLPPGRTGWPIIGEMFDFMTAIRRGNPGKFVKERMGKYSPLVFKTRLLGENMVVFCGAEGNKFLFSNENKYVVSWWPASIARIFGPPEELAKYMYSDFTSNVRTSLVEFLKPEFLCEYVPIMDSLAKQHVETDWSPHEQVKVFPLAKKHAFTLACNLFMNMKDTALIKRLEDPFLAITTGIISMPVNFPGTAFNRAMKAAKTVREQLLGIIMERKKELRKNIVDTRAVDLLTRILRQKGGGDDVDEMHMTYEFMTFLLASYDTMSITITFVIYYLEKYPHVYEMVFQEQMAISNSKNSGELLNWSDVQNMKYSWWVACEALRLIQSGGTFREVIADFQFAGFTIPKGWKAHWTPESTHKDPKYFPNPENFDPLRYKGNGPPPFSFVPFGGGPRMCPGREFARLATLTFIHNVVKKFKFKSLNPHEKIIYNPNPNPADGLLMQLLSA